MLAHRLTLVGIHAYSHPHTLSRLISLITILEDYLVKSMKIVMSCLVGVSVLIIIIIAAAHSQEWVELSCPRQRCNIRACRPTYDASLTRFRSGRRAHTVCNFSLLNKSLNTYHRRIEGTPGELIISPDSFQQLVFVAVHLPEFMPEEDRRNWFQYQVQFQLMPHTFEQNPPAGMTARVAGLCKQEAQLRPPFGPEELFVNGVFDLPILNEWFQSRELEIHDVVPDCECYRGMIMCWYSLHTWTHDLKFSYQLPDGRDNIVAHFMGIPVRDTLRPLWERGNDTLFEYGKCTGYRPWNTVGPIRN